MWGASLTNVLLGIALFVVIILVMLYKQKAVYYVQIAFLVLFSAQYLYGMYGRYTILSGLDENYYVMTARKVADEFRAAGQIIRKHRQGAAGMETADEGVPGPPMCPECSGCT